MQQGNLFAAIPTDLSDERFDFLAGSGQTRIERIVSRGHYSPPDFWYDQAEHEFVVLLQGSAVLELEGVGQQSLEPGGVAADTSGLSSSRGQYCAGWGYGVAGRVLRLNLRKRRAGSILKGGRRKAAVKKGNEFTSWP